MMNPKLLDMVAIVSLSLDEVEVPSLHNVVGTDLGSQVNKKNNAYSTFINIFNRGSGPISETENKASCSKFAYFLSAPVR